MSEIQFDVNVANGVDINVVNDVLPVWWMLVYPFRVNQSESLLHAEIKWFTVHMKTGSAHWCCFFCLTTNRPDSPTTFLGTCKGNFLCLQMISFEFLRVDPIGWIVSRGKHFVHMTRPGARDWPAACFSRPISHTLAFTTIQQVNK